MGNQNVQQIAPLGTTRDGKSAARFLLTNDSGASLDLTALGATVLRINVPDRSGEPGNVNLGQPGVQSIEGPGSPYLGATCGRVANRIAGGKFVLDGHTCQLTRNERDMTHLHGGAVGYDRRVWTHHDHFSPDGPSMLFKLTDPAGAEHYPGTVQVEVRYTLTHANVLRIDYVATTDAPTPINLTNHAYFNLKDAGATDVLGHEIRISASRYTPVNDALIPTGAIAPVAGTPLDLTKPGRTIGAELPQLSECRGFDHNYVIDGTLGTLRHAAEVYEPTTGRTMAMFTTEPAVQFYSGNVLSGKVVSIDGHTLNQYGGFCLEAQHYPDSINHPYFPNTVLRPGQTYRQTTEYRFGVR
jgi:aldose 1-epimerase